MFSLFILLRASLKTTFVKERINVVRAYTGSSSRAVKVSTREAILALAAAVFFRLITPERSLKGETASERTQAFTLSKENDGRNNLPRGTVISLGYQLHVTVDSFHYLKTFRRSDL